MTTTWPTADSDATRARFDAAETVTFYENFDHLLHVEKTLFDRFIQADSRVLDLGVGAGRTTRALANRAAHYVGVDYAANMVDACARRHPDLRIELGDAANLAAFGDASFDCVVFSFNGIDYLPTDAARQACFHEVSRVLTDGGTFILSMHNPRALIADARVRPDDASSLRWKKRVRALGPTLRQAARTVGTRAFWHGTGYVHDRTHGGLHQHAMHPARAIAELESSAFVRLAGPLAFDAPRRFHSLSTGWYYLALARAPRSVQVRPNAVEAGAP